MAFFIWKILWYNGKKIQWKEKIKSTKEAHNKDKLKFNEIYIDILPQSECYLQKQVDHSNDNYQTVDTNETESPIPLSQQERSQEKQQTEDKEQSKNEVRQYPKRKKRNNHQF